MNVPDQKCSGLEGSLMGLRSPGELPVTTAGVSPGESDRLSADSSLF